MPRLARALVSALASALVVPALAAGATLNINMSGNLDSLDPSQAYLTSSWAVEYATCLKLVNYPDAPAPGGSVPRPEGAATFRVSSDGLT